MRLREATKIIENKKGYRVHFDEPAWFGFCNDYFPNFDEEPFDDESIAWLMAEKFAEKTLARGFKNIYVVDENYKPVKNYQNKILNKKK